MDTVEYSQVVGVFRERSQAEQAIDDLKQIGIREDRIQLTEYNLHSAGEIDSTSRQESYIRLVVSVQADDKVQEAVGVMVKNGANNADIPHGTEIVQGSLVSSNAQTADSKSVQPTGEGTPDNFFGKNEKDPYIP